MHLFYIDESYDNHSFVVSAFGLRVERWRPLLVAIQDFRRSLRDKFGIKITREIHASSFIRDCGDDISTRKLNLGERKHVFELCLRQWASFAPNVQVINVCLAVPGHGDLETAHFRAIQRAVNRIERTMQARNSQAILIFDEGKERQITGMLRRMAVFNPIPSNLGVWPDGSATRNIALLKIIEDPVFRPSHRSYFLQCADHCAFTLLKRETKPPAPFIHRWGYHRLFPLLAPLRFLPASPGDPDGISR